jgi:HAD superfamily hydrolase (TIGR01490 family)
LTPKPAAFFDLDKTVIARASMVAMGGPLYREGLISRWLLLRALWGQIVYLWFGADETKLARMRDSVLRLTAGWDREHVRRIARDAIEEVIEPIVYEEALELIASHQAAGEPVYLVSASPEEIVAPLADHLGVDGYLATIAAVTPEGRYTGRVDLYCYGPEKVTAMQALAAKEGLDLAASAAYSDSATDEPMLAAVGHPIAVNPDRELLRIARERNWEVQWFVRPVRLRDRIPRPRPASAVAVGGGLVAVVAGGVTWLWLRRERTAPPPARGTDVAVRIWRDVVRRGAPAAQAWRTFLAATVARAMSTSRIRSFFIGRRP